MNSIFKNRTGKLQKKIIANESVLLSSSSDITYFTNFNFLVPEEREAFVFITKASVNLIHSSFSPVDDYEHINYLKGSYPNQLANHLDKIIENEKIDKILIDKETLFVAELNAIQDKLPKMNIEDYDSTLVRDLKNIKEPGEIAKIKKACRITALVMQEIKNKLHEGITELEVKKLIRRLFEDSGTDELAFPTIVAFGKNSALPHHQPSEKKLEADMPVLIDMGAKFEEYCSDMTRTFWFGENPTKKFLEIEGVVKSAYRAGFEKLGSKATSPSIRAKDVDNATRMIISNKGYAQKFIHTTGHGLGLSIHEQPSISWSNKTEIVPGMVITIEPGIYLKGEFGYRYENTVLVGESKVIELTTKN